MGVEGVVSAEVSFEAERADVRYRPDVAEPARLVKAVEESGFGAQVIKASPEAGAQKPSP